MKNTRKKTEHKILGDCELKSLVLKTVAKQGNNCTSRQIFDSINYDNYNSFRVCLSRYVKNGYLKKDGTKRPFYYYLTKKGREHAQDPYILKKRRFFLYRKHISEMLINEKEFRKGLSIFIQHQPGIALHEICMSPYFRNDDSFHGFYRNIIYRQERKIEELFREIEDLRAILYRLRMD